MPGLNPSESAAAAVAKVRSQHGEVVMAWGAELIVLAAHAEDVAHELRERFGESVELVLGTRRFPSGSWWPEEPTDSQHVHDPLADTRRLPDWLDVQVDAPAVVTIGPDQKVRAVITNRGRSDVSILTAGPPALLAGYLTHPGELVALSTAGGARHLAAVLTPVASQTSVELPVVFGVGATWHTQGFTVAPGGYELIAVVPVASAAYATDPSAVIHYRTQSVALIVR